MKITLSENEIKQWSFRLEVAKFLAVVVGGYFALNHYYHDAKTEFEAPVWNEQARALLATADTTAQLACQPVTDAKWAQARDQFWTYYYGSLCILEDSNIEKTMVDFGEGEKNLEDIIKKGQATKEQDINSETGGTIQERIEQQQALLKRLSLTNAYACRQLIVRQLSKKLPDINNLKLEKLQIDEVKARTLRSQTSVQTNAAK